MNLLVPEWVNRGAVADIQKSVHQSGWEVLSPDEAALFAEIQHLKTRLSELEADMRWRTDWHDRLGRGAMTEGRFYERIETLLAKAGAVQP
jgi:hypothetical protein